MIPTCVKSGKSELKKHFYEDQKNLLDKEIIDKTVTKNQMAQFNETTKKIQKPKIEIQTIMGKYSRESYKTQLQIEQNAKLQKIVWKGK